MGFRGTALSVYGELFRRERVPAHEERPVERLIVTGIDRDLFEDLVDAKSKMHISFYQLAHKYREQQQELEGKHSLR